jgi:hypothetical protein
MGNRAFATILCTASSSLKALGARALYPMIIYYMIQTIGDI